jgi:hypothetical protein
MKGIFGVRIMWMTSVWVIFLKSGVFGFKWVNLPELVKMTHLGAVDRFKNIPYS